MISNISVILELPSRPQPWSHNPPSPTPCQFRAISDHWMRSSLPDLCVIIMFNLLDRWPMWNRGNQHAIEIDFSVLFFSRFMGMRSSAKNNNNFKLLMENCENYSSWVGEGKGCVCVCVKVWNCVWIAHISRMFVMVVTSCFCLPTPALPLLPLQSNQICKQFKLNL